MINTRLVNYFSKLSYKLFLLRWAGKKRIGRNKHIRLKRTYEFVHKDVIDIRWTLREIKDDGSISSPKVISERVNLAGVKTAIQQIEQDNLPRLIKHFAEKIGETL